jgi:hypothetical protein
MPSKATSLTFIIADCDFYEQDNYINTAYGKKKISDSYHTQFLGITRNIINTLSWKRHVAQLLLKLNTACSKVAAVPGT